MLLFCVFSLVLTLAQTIEAAGPKCFSCSKIPFPRDCDTVIQCGDHEDCGVEQVVLESGHIVYNVGCEEKTTCQLANTKKRGEPFRNKRGDILTCMQCCNEGFCNNQGCGMEGFELETRGPYCFHCSVQLGQSTCDTVTVCGAEQRCLLQTTTPFPGVSENVYKSGCVAAKQCTVLESASVSADTCASCCDQDFCNDKCSHSNPSSHTTKTVTTTPAVSSTTAPPAVTAKVQSNTSPTQTPTTRAPVPYAGPTDAQCTAHRHGYANAHLQHSALCYKIHKEVKTWYEATEVCNKEKARLVVLDSEEKNGKMLSLLNDHAYSHLSFWIGLNDRHNNSNFIWQTEAQLTFADWGHAIAQQPDNGKRGIYSQDCVIMYHGDHHHWHDDHCWSRAGFICEAQDHAVNGAWTPYTKYSTCHFESQGTDGHKWPSIHHGDDKRDAHMAEKRWILHPSGSSHHNSTSKLDLSGYMKHHKYRSCMNPPPSGGGRLCGRSHSEHFSEQTNESCTSKDFGHFHIG